MTVPDPRQRSYGYGPPPDLDLCGCGHVMADHTAYADDRYQTPCLMLGCPCIDFVEDLDDPS